MTPASWRPSLLPALVRFWNRAFAGKRNFLPVDDALLRRRVLRRGTRGLAVALDGAEIVGMVHAVRRPEAACRALDPAWPGGMQGVVEILYVEPSRRRRGIGDALWHAALERLRGTRQVVLGGCGAEAGVRTPLWGTPAGIAVEWSDSATKKFLARKGFAPRAKGVQLAVGLPPGPGPDLARAVARLGLRLESASGRLPRIGRPWADARAVPAGVDLESVGAVRRGRTVGVFAAFRWKEVAPDLWGIHQGTVAEERRGGVLGRRLLQALLGRIRERGGRRVEALVLPELAPAALRLYEAEGFQAVASWAVY